MSSTGGRRLSPAVYRRRRLVVILALLVVAAVVTLLIWQPWNGAAAEPETAGKTTAPTTPATPDPTATDTPTPEATPEETPTPEPSPTGAEEPLTPCSSGIVDVVATVDKEAYAAGELPQLGLQLTNRGDVACAINVGTSGQSFVITSGSDTWWRSTDCQVEPSDQVVRLEAGQSVSTLEPLVWDRTRSAVDTCEGDRQAASAGYYHLSVSIGGIDAPDGVMFRLL